MLPKVATGFACIKCDYKCYNKNNYNKHLATRKHSMDNKDNDILPIIDKIYDCSNCGNVYKYQSGLCKHKKTCIKENSGNLRFPEPFPLIRHEGVVRETVGFVSSPNDENIILSNLVKELVQSNQDLAKQTQELHKHIIELSENIRFPLR